MSSFVLYQIWKLNWFGKLCIRSRNIGKKEGFFYILLEKQNWDSFLPISQDLVHIFQNWFLFWNPGFKLVVLSTMNPIIGFSFLNSKKRCRLECPKWKCTMVPMFRTSNGYIFSLPIIGFHEKCIFTLVWHVLLLVGLQKPGVHIL